MELTCLVLDNDPVHAKKLVAFCADQGFSSVAAHTLASGREKIAETGYDLVFVAFDLEDGHGLDILDADSLDASEIMVMGDHDDPKRADEAIRRGASYFFCKPFDPKHLKTQLRDIVAESEIAEQDPDNSELPCVVDQFGYLRGSSPRMRKLYRLLRKVAPTEASLLLIGESGTGKELVARTVHDLSPRAEGPFVAFNCASVADTLIESELFGHEKGSFSGADRLHFGFFEQASGGTLMLDEITEMNIDLQARLLRVLEERKLRRVGGEVDIPLDVRIISATNRPPDLAVEEGHLREDLYYRLAQFPVVLPPLRSRGDDVRGLAQYFLNELNELHQTQLRFADATLNAITGYSWPGNVRQLKNSVERAYILSESVIEVDALPDLDKVAKASLLAGESIEVSLGSTLADSERDIILATLERNDGDKKQTAAELGVSLKTLYNRLNEYESGSESEEAV